jgi:hypothetical protein
MSNNNNKRRSLIPGYTLIPKNGVYQIKKIAISGERFKTDPAFDLPRKKAAEFGKAAKLGKIIRHAFLQDTDIRHDAGRLQAVLLKVLNTDKENAYGKRSFEKADFFALREYDFNRNAPLNKLPCLHIGISPNKKKDKLFVTIPPLVPRNIFQTNEPDKFFRISFIGVTIDLRENLVKKQVESTDVFQVAGLPFPAHEFKFTVSKDPEHVFLLAVFIEYYKWIAGVNEFYRLFTFQTMTILTADRCC